MQGEKVECDLTWVVSWGAVWTEAVLLSWCQANLLQCLIVGDIGKYIPYETGDQIYCQSLCIPQNEK